MAKKDTAATVLGMLSTTGASTRPTSPLSTPEPTVDAAGIGHKQPAAAVVEQPTVVPEQPSGAEKSAGIVSAEPPDPPVQHSTRSAGRGVQRRRAPASNGTTEVVPEVPRTLRLRASTAAAVRDAWLEAKRADVLLSHQDFASDLLDAALARRHSPRH